jgi:four helix bundle protein
MDSFRKYVALPSQFRRIYSEGYERNHRKEYVQFLFVSKGSLGEVETHLLLAKDLGYLSEKEYSAIESKRSETARLLNGLIKSLV